jgi:hypothetical protein
MSLLKSAWALSSRRLIRLWYTIFPRFSRRPYSSLSDPLLCHGPTLPKYSTLPLSVSIANILNHNVIVYPGFVRQEPPTGKRIGVIGAGPAGLAALKVILDSEEFKAGLWQPIVFEARGDVGGVWCVSTLTFFE